MGHAGTKTKTLGKILEKPFVCSRSQIFCRIIIKLGQNVCLDEILEELENMSDKKLGQVLEKPCVCSRGHIFSPIIMKVGQNVLMKS